MKLFVWEDVLTDYTSGVMVVLAKDVGEARAALRKECSYLPEGDVQKEPTVYKMSDAPVVVVSWGGS